MCNLSRRELEALSLLAQGYSNRMIAEQLAITLPTVALHLQGARRRLAAKSREHAVALAVARGFIKVADANTWSAGSQFGPQALTPEVA
jgi:DNA-binding CsgD family transcriptional regulator